MVALVALLIGILPTGIAQTAVAQTGVAQTGVAQTGVAQTGVARLPAAYVDTGAARVPLVITSWCWDLRCGAPLGHSTRRVSVARGAPVRVELKLVPVEATVTVGGTRMNATVSGSELSWPATRSGGISAFVRYRRGWVIYSAPLALH